MDSPQQPDFTRLLAGLTSELERHGIPFMVIGGQAVLLHGRPRLTEDIDVTLGADPSALPAVRQVCSALRLEPLPQDIERFVRETFVLPARQPDSGLRVDFIFSTTPYERQAIDRAVRVPLAGAAVPFAAAEDLLIHKLFAGRPRDLEDATGVARRKGRELDWGYVRRWAQAFAEIPGREGLPERVERLERDATGGDEGPV